MKTKYIFVFFILGSIFDTIGGSFENVHWPGGSELLTLSTILIVVFWLLLLWKTFTHPSLRDFMNK